MFFTALECVLFMKMAALPGVTVVWLKMKKKISERKSSLLLFLDAITSVY